MIQTVGKFEGHCLLGRIISYPVRLPAEPKVHDYRMKAGPTFKGLEGWLQRKISRWLDGSDQGADVVGTGGAQVSLWWALAPTGSRDKTEFAPALGCGRGSHAWALCSEPRIPASGGRHAELVAFRHIHLSLQPWVPERSLRG